MKGEKVRDITSLAKLLAISNPLGYRKIRAILKKAEGKSRQRWYQVVNKLMGLCARCNRPLAVGNKEHCEYHLVAVRKAVQARTKNKVLIKKQEMDK